MRTKKLIFNCIMVVLALIILLAITIAILFFYNEGNNINVQNTNEENNSYINTIQNSIGNNLSNTIENETVDHNIIKEDENTSQDTNIEQVEYTPDYYLKDYTTKAVYDTEQAYNLLDEEYRQKRFPSIDNYKEYVSENFAKLENTTVLKYELENKGTYIQYNIIDSNNYCYIINVYGNKEYKVIADNYTLDLNIEEYNKGSEKDKVAINIEKIVEAFNVKDYAYIYSKLSEEFKAQKYLTLQQFEEEMSNTLYGTFTVKFGDFIVNGDNYIYDIELLGNTASSSSLSMQIIMELKDEGDFAMSFDIKEVN